MDNAFFMVSFIVKSQCSCRDDELMHDQEPEGCGLIILGPHLLKIIQTTL